MGPGPPKAVRKLRVLQPDGEQIQSASRAVPSRIAKPPNTAAPLEYQRCAIAKAATGRPP
eukprot:11868041-Alexandrium_andersonii.AAC.1